MEGVLINGKSRPAPSPGSSDGFGKFREEQDVRSAASEDSCVAPRQLRKWKQERARRAA